MVHASVMDVPCVTCVPRGTVNLEYTVSYISLHRWTHARTIPTQKNASRPAHVFCRPDSLCASNASLKRMRITIKHGCWGAPRTAPPVWAAAASTRHSCHGRGMNGCDNHRGSVAKARRLTVMTWISSWTARARYCKIDGPSPMSLKILLRGLRRGSCAVMVAKTLLADDGQCSQKAWSVQGRYRVPQTGHLGLMVREVSKKWLELRLGMGQVSSALDQAL